MLKNGTQQNDTQQNDTQQNDTQHNDIQNDKTRQNNKNAAITITFWQITLKPIMTIIITLSVIMLSGIMLIVAAPLMVAKISSN